MKENTKGMTAAADREAEKAAKAYLMDLYDYFRMDSSMDPIILFEQFCCVLASIHEHFAVILDPGSMDIPALTARWYEDLIHTCHMFFGWDISAPDEFKSRPELLRRMLGAVQALMKYADKGSLRLGPLLSDFLETILQSRQNEIIRTPLQTAREIVKLLYQEKQAAFWGNMLDPACGSGAFLIALLEQAKEDDEGNFLWILNLERDEHLRNCVAILSWFYQSPPISIEIKDSGTVPQVAKESFDLILANPPFRTQSLRDREKFGDDAHLPVPTNDLHRAFIQRTLLGLKPGGESAIIVPDSFLTHTASDAIQVRQWIVEKFQCVAVVKLPYYTFYPQAAINASVLFIRNLENTRKSSAKREKIFFFTVETDGRSNDTRRQPVPQNDFDELRQVWNRREALWEEWHGSLPVQNVHGMPVPEQWEHPHFWFGSLEDVSRSDYSLLPEQYQPVQLLREPVQDPEELLAELRNLGGEIIELMEQLAEAEYER